MHRVTRVVAPGNGSLGPSFDDGASGTAHRSNLAGRGIFAPGDITPLPVFAGRQPPRALGIVIEWATPHQQRLLDGWRTSRSRQFPAKIDPLPEDGC